MKIVSLKSVALSEVRLNGDIYRPSTFKVGDKLKVGDSIFQTTRIEDIKFYNAGETSDVPFAHYRVFTSDNHIRVLPAVQYIAEYAQ